ncbi:hypothetical protein KKA53_00655 [Candidatus Dependentiae bacterium]|nr:hypothetical protein [Candidatus Dependentiae bacterium]
MSKQVTRITLVAAIIVFGFPSIGQSEKEAVDKHVYQRGLSALKNIIDVRSELEEKLEDLVDQEKKIGEEKKELRMVVKDIDGVFPKGKEDLSVRARGFARRIRDIDRVEKTKLDEAVAYIQKKKLAETQSLFPEPVVRQKSGKGVLAGVLVGAAVSLAAGFFFWKVVGKKDRSKKSSAINNDHRFIQSMASYLEQQVQ